MIQETQKHLEKLKKEAMRTINPSALSAIITTDKDNNNSNGNDSSNAAVALTRLRSPEVGKVSAISMDSFLH